MNDHIDPDKLREILSGIENGVYDVQIGRGVSGIRADLEALLPTPKPKTLADLIEQGHDPAQYQWRQAEHRGERFVILRVVSTSATSTVRLLDPAGINRWVNSDEVIPHPDKPRLVWPAESHPEPAEDSSTPEGAPKALVTEEDYRNTPRDTVVKDTTYPVSDVWDKWYENEWRTATRSGSSKSHTNAEMADTTRQVIWAPEVQE